MIAQSRMERPVSISGAVTPEDIAESMQMVNRYVEPYRKLMGSAAEGQRLSWMVGGLTSNLERKSVEPIAVMYGVPRGQLQSFMGYSRWEHRPLLELMLSEVAREIGIPDGSLIVDGSGSPKKGTATVGVARQWCGNRGKVDNCVIGVYAVYVGAQNSAALVGAELFLPKEWTEDKERRDKSYVPEHIVYHSQAEIASGFVHDLAGRLPFEWVLGDDEFGRARHFRDAIAELQRGYVLDVPENTNARRVRRNGKLCKRLWTVKELAQSRPVREWQYFHVRDAEKGPVEVRVLSDNYFSPPCCLTRKCYPSIRPS